MSYDRALFLENCTILGIVTFINQRQYLFRNSNCYEHWDDSYRLKSNSSLRYEI